jgi:hypothetical protein
MPGRTSYPAESSPAVVACVAELASKSSPLARKGKQMTETGIRSARHALGADDGANAADSSKSRLAMHIWTLLHAQALLRGPVGGPGDALNAEDDRWRRAAHRETTHRR